MKLRSSTLQNYEELLWYTKLSIDLNVKKYLEIGTYTGDTMYAVLANTASKDTLGISIDPSKEPFKQCYLDLLSEGYDVRLLTGDSKDKAIIDQAKSYGLYDLILIDGDHSYDGVKSDWENYNSLGKVIAIHDVCGRDNPFTKNVYRFWSEIKQGRQYIEVNFGNYQYGYGVIFNGTSGR